ncbi:MAG: tripartite tricarboxylate transporter TctB family protein [Pseudomonadota bacterium]|jgi:putative tricarboxylic transport membrane protein
MSDQGGAGLRFGNSELWGGMIGLALGAFVIWSGVRFNIGTVNDPGSGFVLFYTGILMCLFAGSITVAALTEGGPDLRSLWAGTRWTKTVIVIAGLAVFAFAFDRLGFLLASIPLMLFLLRAIDPVRWTLAIPIAFLVPLGSWWVLKRLLLIQLPSGIFGIG